MANQVFANDLEIACKAAKGASKACFPDVCFTPPSPPAGWIPVPYANTTFAKDTANASKTVFITNKPVMLKDHSYFKTSTGNEPAAGPKGIVTGTKKGKAYFRTWSMNVKIEGYNVTRHTDLMTHNHNPKVGNTVVWPYYDEGFFSSPCKKEHKRIEKACGEKKKKNRKSRGGPPKKDIQWKEKHCKGLMVSPLSPNSPGAKPDKLIKELDQALDNLNVDTILTDAVSSLKEELMARGAMFLVKQGAKKIPIVGWAYQIATISDDIAFLENTKLVWDSTVKEVDRISTQANDLKNQITDLKGSIQKAQTAKAAGKKVNGGDIQSQLADLQRTLATANPCVRARKCVLEPYSTTKHGAGKDSTDDKSSKKGCCPGQTGHHLIPGSFFDKKGQSCGKKYNHDEAPTVCAEGSSHSQGSHGAAHTAMNKFGGRAADKKTKEISYEDAREAAIKSHLSAFPLSVCSADCLRSQLDEYFADGIKCDDDSKLKYKKIGGDSNAR